MRVCVYVRACVQVCVSFPPLYTVFPGIRHATWSLSHNVTVWGWLMFVWVYVKDVY